MSKQGSIFLDSGAFTLFYQKSKKFEKSSLYYDSKEFWDYVDQYGRFVRKNPKFDIYANVDVIGDPEKSWEVLKYLEKKYKINPLPVVHNPAGIEWIERHVKAGYKFIGIGGIAKRDVKSRRAWLNMVFEYLCPKPTRLPIIKTHGFGISSFTEITSYPWYSVDSTTWVMVAAFGGIYVPPLIKGEWAFDRSPLKVMISTDNPRMKKIGQHFHSFSEQEKNVIRKWIDYVKLPFGKVKEDGSIVWGVSTHPKPRSIANLHYFEMLQDSIPPYPVPFQLSYKKSFSL